MKMIFKVSVERCIACGKCELACAFAHGSEGRPAKTRINIHRRGPELGTPIVCFQCDDAACAAVWDETYHCVQKCDLCGGDPRCVPFCPTGAISWVPIEEAVIPPEPLDRESLTFETGTGL